MQFGGPVFFLQMTGSMTEVFAHADILARVILCMATVMSIISWAIMITKARLFRVARRQTNKFLKVYDGEKSLSGLIDQATKAPKSPEARLVKQVAIELEKGSILNADALDRTIDGSVVSIVSDFEKNIIFLGTTAAACPLMGLFGTIWGIMVAFMSMGVQGSASLLVVGPGIAISLIVTFFGLGAAIPALVGYNYNTRFVRNVENELVTFSGTFRNRIVEKTYEELARIPGEVFATQVQLTK
ncbi:MAG TPA: MotA/TolQ/ExbB proton channel family protein [Candidatus Bathyarchaeia archaeon]|nr:MotA/TolQ/ExbB proton channel family protein [Candidatus Bathyarchaeia archaeon]